MYCTEVVGAPFPIAGIGRITSLVFWSRAGFLFLTTPDAGHFSVRGKLIAWDNVKPPEHLTLFTKQGLRHALKPLLLHAPWFFPNRKPGIQLIARRQA